MLNHIVLFRRKPDVEKQPALERALIARMNALNGQIDHIRHWKLSVNELQRAISWDLALESRFDDTAGLDGYLFHPAHIALVSDLKTYYEWAAVDYSV